MNKSELPKTPEPPLREEGQAGEQELPPRHSTYESMTLYQLQDLVISLISENESLKATNDAMVSAINWACGCGDDDFTPSAGASGFLGTFWWRSELVKKAGLTWDREATRYVRKSADLLLAGEEKG